MTTLTEQFIRDAVLIDPEAKVNYFHTNIGRCTTCDVPAVGFTLIPTESLIRLADRFRFDKGFKPMKPVNGMSCTILMTLSFPQNIMKAHAVCCRKDGFDKSRYTLTGNMAEDAATIAKSQKGRYCDDFGYSGVDWGAWCDEYVADCLENAGCDSSIVAHGGTVADFANAMRQRGAVQVSTPQTGDLVFFTYSHVEIVTRVENGIVYSAGGNNKDPNTNTYHDGGCCAGEHRTYNASYYLRPAYNNTPITPDSIAFHSGSVSDITTNDAVISTWTTNNNGEIFSTGFWIGTDQDNPPIYNIRITNIDTTGYTISCEIRKDIDIDRVQFPTWTDFNGQDDIQADWTVSEKAGGTPVGNTYVYRVKSSEHNNELGPYITHIYAYDKDGNYYHVSNGMNVAGLRQVTLNETVETPNGDVNNDGSFNVSDVVLLQKWLLAVPDTHLGNWQAANFCKDDRLDVFDLCLMKRNLINNKT